jgi:hypothetical protein
MVGEKNEENADKAIFEAWGEKSKSLWRLWNEAKKWMDPQFVLKKVGGSEVSSSIAIGTELRGNEVTISKEGKIKIFFDGKLLIDTADEKTIFIKVLQLAIPA